MQGGKKENPYYEDIKDHIEGASYCLVMWMGSDGNSGGASRSRSASVRPLTHHRPTNLKTQKNTTALEITYVGGDATYERLLKVCGRTYDFVDFGPRYVYMCVYVRFVSVDWGCASMCVCVCV